MKAIASKASIAIVHPQVGFGGSEAAVLWGIEALKQDCEAALITGGAEGEFDWYLRRLARRSRLADSFSDGGKPMNRVKRIVYAPSFLRVLRALRLTDAVRSLHYIRVARGRGVFHVTLCGTQAVFRTANPHELIQVEFNLMLEHEMLSMIAKHLRRGDVFMDVGANIGVFSVMGGLIVGEEGQVIAFEPYKRAFDQLERNLNLNGLRNVTPFRVALSQDDGTARLYVDRPAPSLTERTLNTKEEERYESIETARGDGFREIHALPVPNVVKIDVEGFEYAVLQGLRATLSDWRCKFVICEVHPHLLPSGVTPEAIKAFFESLGFDEISELRRRQEIQVVAHKRATANVSH